MTVQKKLSSREIRRVLGAAAPTIGQLAHNDGVNQRRIGQLEAQQTVTEAFRAMTLWQRLRWIVRGEQ